MTGHPPSPCYGEASRPVATGFFRAKRKGPLAKTIQLLDISTCDFWGLYEELDIPRRVFISSGSNLRPSRSQCRQYVALRHDAAGFRHDETRGHSRRDPSTPVSQPSARPKLSGPANWFRS